MMKCLQFQHSQKEVQILPLLAVRTQPKITASWYHACYLCVRPAEVCSGQHNPTCLPCYWKPGTQRVNVRRWNVTKGLISVVTFLSIRLARCSKAWRKSTSNVTHFLHQMPQVFFAVFCLCVAIIWGQCLSFESTLLLTMTPSDLWPHQCCGQFWQRFPRREYPGSEQAAPLSHSPQPSWPPSHTCCRLAVAPHLKKHAGGGREWGGGGREIIIAMQQWMLEDQLYACTRSGRKPILCFVQ